MFRKLAILAISLVLLLSVGLIPVLSDNVYLQDENQADPTAVVIEGPVQAINVNVVTIADINVTLDAGDPLLTTLEIGDVVEVVGQPINTTGSTTIQATSIVVTGANIISPVITLYGPVQAVNVNIVTIFNIDIQFAPDDPILDELNVGDIIEVNGNIAGFGGTLIIVPVQVVIVVNVPPSTNPPDPGSGVLLNSFLVHYLGRDFDGNQTTFNYVVSGTGSPPDLSHFDIEIVVCDPVLEVTAYSPTEAVSFGLDPTTGVDGIKWDLPLQTTATRNYSLSFAGNVPEGLVTVAVKGGNGFESALLPGAGCSSASVDIEKLISVDGATWQDADTAPGPDVELGTQVMFRFEVSNTGETELSNFSLTDNLYDLSSCPVPALLPVGARYDCTIGPIDAIAGQHSNVATVRAFAGDVEVQDDDAAHYFGGDHPSIDIEKFVSTDSANWQDADDAPGLEVEPESEVYFRFTVTNDGNVPLSGLALSDNVSDTSTCSLPAELAPGAGFECVIGPFATTDAHSNTATVTASYLDMPVSDSDSAHYFMGDDETNDPVIIVIEGPVQAININIITIFDIDIEIDPNDPILTQIQIGDVIRIEGLPSSSGDSIIIVAVTIIIINIDQDIVIDDDDDDDGDSGGPVVQPPSIGFSKDDCKRGGWQNLTRADGSGFRNQGACVSYTNTGR